jgi:hypothetical protein
MLLDKVQNARVMRFGYRSNWFGGKEIEVGAVSVTDISERLLKELESNRKVKASFFDLKLATADHYVLRK